MINTAAGWRTFVEGQVVEPGATLCGALTVAVIGLPPAATAALDEPGGEGRVFLVEEDDALPGQPASLRVVGTATVAPRNLEVFKLGPREVDGSADGTFNTGSGTALTRHAYRVPW